MKKGTIAGVAAFGLTGLALGLAGGEAKAQDPAWMQQTCGNIATALTIGDQRAAFAFGPNARMTIGAQTGGSGLYPQLAAVGTPHTALLGGSQLVPGGVVFTCQTWHQTGYADWYFGISGVTGLIEHISFTVTPAEMPSAPSPFPSTTEQDEDEDTTSPPQPQAPSESEACKKFPELC